MCWARMLWGLGWVGSWEAAGGEGFAGAVVCVWVDRDWEWCAKRHKALVEEGKGLSERMTAWRRVGGEQPELLVVEEWDCGRGRLAGRGWGRGCFKAIFGG